jgi:hypothetical protein
MSTPVATRRSSLVSCLLAAVLMAACSSTPPPPDWKLNAVSLLEHYQARWLEGDSKAADLALENSRKEVAKTGRLDLLARLELAACGTRTAALDFAACTAYVPLAGDAAASDKAYAQLLGGDWSGLDVKSLPPQYVDLVGAKDDAAANHAVAAIKAPLPRLIAAALLFKQGRAMPATLTEAVDTASAQGWRRPLLTWLEVQRKRAEAAGDQAAALKLQRRLDFVLGQ